LIWGILIVFGLQCLADTIVFPNTEADNYLSIVGQLDPRCDLYVNTTKAAKADSKRADALVFPDEDVGARATADVCVMAAKLAYENPAVVERVVKDVWGMHFVKFYNSWNGKLSPNPTVALQRNRPYETSRLNGTLISVN